MLNCINVFCSRRRWLKRLVINRLDDTASVYLKKFDLKIFYNPKDLTGPSFHLAYDLDEGFANYESAEKSEILKYLSTGGRFVDVGANIGMFSLFILKELSDVEVYAFEPEPLNFSYINKSRESNKLNRLNLFQCAIGKEEKELKLYKSSKNDGGHSLVRNGGTDDPFDIVKVMPLKKILPNKSRPIDVLKIDVEGAELGVLEGAVDLIKEDKPFMLIESSNHDFAEKKGIFSLLQDHFGDNIYARLPGKEEKMSLECLSTYGKAQLTRDISCSNYIFQFI